MAVCQNGFSFRTMWQTPLCTRGLRTPGKEVTQEKAAMARIQSVLCTAVLLSPPGVLGVPGMEVS